MSLAPGGAPAQARTHVTEPRSRAHLAIILALALFGVGLRVWAFDPFAVHHPDEVFQYLEQAHRLAFGYGVAPWEYRYGVRSWLLPLALSGPMLLGAAADPNGLGWIVAPRLLMAVLAGGTLWSAYAIGARRSPIHGLVALAVTAVWCEGVYFGVHGLTETLATSAFLVAAGVDRGASGGPRRLAVVGALLALCAVLRLQYAPAVAVYALVAHGRVPRCWPALALGAAAVLAGSGAVDAAMGQAPFGWAAANVDQNLVKGRSLAYGVSGPLEYLVMLRTHWLVAVPPLFLLAVRGARIAPALAAAAVANLVVHSLIAHKEYRFILLSTTLLVLLAALGTADLVLKLRRRRVLAGLGCALAAWAAASAALAAVSPLREAWRDSDPQTRIMREAGRTPGLCGVAIYDRPPWAFGGYAYLHHPVPIFLTRWKDDERMAPRAFAATSPAFDVVIASENRAGEMPAGYARIACRGADGSAGAPRVCLYLRPGGCRQEAARRWRIDAVLLRHDA